jgi:hypothetical protein
VERSDADDARHAARPAPPVDDRLRRLERVALRPELRQEREADVDIRQPIALQQAAHADRHRGFVRRHAFELDTEETEAVARVARERPFGQVSVRILERAHAAVTDVLEE